MPLRADSRNNVIYNYGYTSCYGGEWANGINLVANYYKPGPDTLAEIAPVIVSPDRGGSWHVSGNVIEGHPDVTEDNILGVDIPTGGITLLTEPVELSEPIEQQSPEDAHEAVLAGCRMATAPRRDAIDARLVADVRAGTGRMINSQSEVGGLVPLAATQVPADRDHDGIPDTWEREHGLKPSDPADAAAIDPETGYSHLELYLNSLGRTGAPNPAAGILAPASHTVLTSGGVHDIVVEAEATAHQSAEIAVLEYYSRRDQDRRDDRRAPPDHLGRRAGGHPLPDRAGHRLHRHRHHLHRRARARQPRHRRRPLDVRRHRGRAHPGRRGGG